VVNKKDRGSDASPKDGLNKKTLISCCADLKKHHDDLNASYDNLFKTLLYTLRSKLNKEHPGCILWDVDLETETILCRNEEYSWDDAMECAFSSFYDGDKIDLRLDVSIVNNGYDSKTGKLNSYVFSSKLLFKDCNVFTYANFEGEDQLLLHTTAKEAMEVIKKRTEQELAMAEIELRNASKKKEDLRIKLKELKRKIDPDSIEEEEE